LSKILLLGEYSGLHNNLKEGLIQLGHEVEVASSGDGKKNIKGDIDLTLKSKYKIKNLKELNKIIREFKGYDIVQFINPYISHRIGVLLYNSIFKYNNKVFCLAAGDDVEFLNFVLSHKMEKYSPFDDYLLNEQKNKTNLPYTTKLDYFLHNRFMKKIDGIVPVMWEYAESYRNSKYANKITRTIPLPINTDKINFKENKSNVGGKVVFYHASNRPSFKGSDIIIEAMKKFQDMYPNDVEMIYADFLPLNEYLEVISKTNVVIDQCRSYSYAMNAVYSMAKGKIVMSGSEQEAIDELGLPKCPVINITPNVNQIISEFEKILIDKNRIEEKGNESRAFIESTHDYIKVSKQYLKSWNSK
jgi:hypothetical protein